jgi:hypothetical protein
MVDRDHRRSTDGDKISVPPSGKRVPDVISYHKDWVVNTWLERTKANSELSVVKLSDVERKDHVPDLLDEAVARACEYQVKVDDRQRAAERHGTLRYHQRFSVGMMILEAQILQEVVAECIRDHVDVIDLAKLMPDIARISATITAELKEAASAYMKQYEWQAQRPDDRTH